MLEDSAHRQESIAETVKQLNAGTLSPWSVPYMELTHCRLENIRFLVLGLTRQELVESVLQALVLDYEVAVQRGDMIACNEMCNGRVEGKWDSLEEDCKELQTKAFALIERRAALAAMNKPASNEKEKAPTETESRVNNYITVQTGSTVSLTMSQT